jgi:IPT/TIG domain
MLTTLHSFNGTDGSTPYGGLGLRTTGVFFGVTSAGGSGGLGSAFNLSTGLGAFVEPLPTSGAVGASVIILGTKLTGATSVTFNGVAAAFQVVSGSEITTTVPTGATTGPVVVVTPNATLTSNVNFVVR